VSDSSGNAAEENTRTVNVVDSTPPVITLLGDAVMTLEVGTPYGEPGCTATDNYDGDITEQVVVTGSVNHNNLGTYIVYYNVSDSSGNAAEENTRTVNVVDSTPPVITLLGDNPMTLQVGTGYVEPGYSATDNHDGDVSGNVVVSGSVGHNVCGVYTLRYNVSDSSGNLAEEEVRTVKVSGGLPHIILQGEDPVILEVGVPYVESGYEALDGCGMDITADVVVTGVVNHNVLGSYTLRYNVTDSVGNTAEEKTRTVEVVAPFAILEIAKEPGGTIRLTWTSRPGIIYTICSSFDLVEGLWSEEDMISSQGEITQWTGALPPGEANFYRVEIR